MAKTYDLTASREKLLEAATRDFGNVAFEPVTLGEETLEILQVADMPAYLDKLVAKANKPGYTVELPLWAKIWPAGSILTMFAMRFPFTPGCSILEVGAGVGLTGLALASKGHHVTITDIDPGALLFIQINALHNGLADRVTVQQVDVTKPELDMQYDHVIGCELFYRQNLLPALVELLEAYMKPTGEALFASDAIREGRMFFDMAKDRFNLMKKDVPFKNRETGEDKVVSMYRIGGKG